MAGNEVIAVDLGGTNLRVALLKNNQIIKYIKRKTPGKTSEIFSRLYGLIESLMNKNVRGIGIACPGPLDKGIIKNPPNLPFRNFNLEKAVKDKFHVKVKVENDANCVAISEEKFGVKKNNFIVLTLGTGIGGGIIINQKIYRGQGSGGELGHMVLDKGKDFESLAAGKRVRQMTRRQFGKGLTINQLIEINNRKSKSILKEISNYLGQGIASLINIFDPEVVLLSGGVRETGDIFLKEIKKRVKRYQIIPGEIPIQWAMLEHPGILGASLLIPEVRGR